MWDHPTSKSCKDIQEMVKSEDWLMLDKIMLKRLAFGTAGIRGRMGPGFGQVTTFKLDSTFKAL